MNIIEPRWAELDTRLERRFADTKLPLARSLAELARAAEDSNYAPARVVHSPNLFVPMVPVGVTPGVNLFGTGHSRCHDEFARNIGLSKCTETLLVRDAVFSPRSATVFSAASGFYQFLTEDWTDTVRDSIGSIDPLYESILPEAFRISASHCRVAYVEKLAVPICGRGFFNYGHFLYDGLPAAWQFAQMYRGTDLAIVGPPLQNWQREILEILGIDKFYMPVFEPTIFSRMLISNLLTLHVSYPTRFVRPIFDILRYRHAMPILKCDRAIFLSRGRSAAGKRVMINRDEVEALLIREGFEIFHPENMSLQEQITVAASSNFIVGESGAALANVGFADPGTKVLEIQPDEFVDGWTRAACMLFGLRWHVFFASTSQHSLAAYPSADLSFYVDPDALRHAVATVRSET